MSRVWIAILIAASLGAQEKAFDVVSFKHTHNMLDGSVIREGKRYLYVPTHNLEFKGTRLSGEASLPVYFRYAFSPLVSPWHLDEQQKGINDEFYEIDARAPAGTTLDDARAMLRTVLVKRMGLVYHFSEKATPIYALVRGSGPLRLKPAIGPEPNPGRMQMGAFKRKSASLTEFSSFLSNVAGRLVLDKTGVQGQFQFDIDWGMELQESHGDPAIALTEVKRMGLKLDPRNEPVRVLVIDHVNKMPTPN